MYYRINEVIETLVWLYANEFGKWFITLFLLVGLLKLPNALKCAAYEVSREAEPANVISQIVKELRVPIEFIVASVFLYLLRLAAIGFFRS